MRSRDSETQHKKAAKGIPSPWNKADQRQEAQSR